MTKKLDYIVFIGRFQPFHIGHSDVVQQALKLAEKVIIIIGSLDKSPDIRNPLSSHAREKIIRSVFNEFDYPEVIVRHQHDHTYNEAKWLASIQNTVANCTVSGGWTDKIIPPFIGLIGYDKDHTTFYLNKFPHWETIIAEQPHDINATRIREEYFLIGDIDANYGFKHFLRNEWFASEDHKHRVIQAMSSADHTDLNRSPGNSLSDEWKYIQEYKASWEGVPFPVNFITVDNLITQSGHLLVVKRGGHPGIGQIALPGGFLDPKETLLDAKIREVREETKLKVPDPVLRGSIVKEHTYDDPDRSVRGRTITHATWFRLNDHQRLPHVQGGDDAAAAWWMPISEFQNRRSEIFEDHLSIVEHLMGL